MSEPKAQKFASISPSDAAALFGVSEKTIRNWMNDKGLPSRSGKRGRLVDWPAALEWYISLRMEEGGNRGNIPPEAPAPALDDPNEDLEAATTRKMRADATLKEISLAEKRGLLVAVPDVQRNIANVAQTIQQKILAFPSRLAPRLVGIDDRNRVFSILSVEANQLCHELAAVGSQPLAASAPEADEDE